MTDPICAVPGCGKLEISFVHWLALSKKYHPFRPLEPKRDSELIEWAKQNPESAGALAGIWSQLIARDKVAELSI